MGPQENRFDAQVVLTRDAMIDGRHVWLYVVSSPLAPIVFVEYEMPSHEIVRRFFDANIEKAEAFFSRVCSKICAGKM